MKRWVECLTNDPDALASFYETLGVYRVQALRDMEDGIEQGDIPKTQVALGRKRFIDQLRGSIKMDAKEEADHARLHQQR